MSKGERIKALRKLNQFSQEEVAKRLGTSLQTIHKYERNIITNIPIDKIEIMAEMFNVSPSYIVGWEESSTSPGDPRLFLKKKLLEKINIATPEELEKISQILKLIENGGDL